jgi:hypothetical protein
MTPERGAGVGPSLAVGAYALAHMTLLRWWLVAVAFAVLVAGCGGSSSAPTGAAVTGRECHANRVSGSLTAVNCPSPDGTWQLKARGRASSFLRLFLARSGQKPVLMYRSGNACCSYLGWARPHLLVFIDYPQVMSLDPRRRKVTNFGSLGDLVVSPNGDWVAGYGPGGPGDPTATTVYVLAVHSQSRKEQCLVVPGSWGNAKGFTPDSKAVIVSGVHHVEQLRQFTLSSLHAGCPAAETTRTPFNSHGFRVGS